jgi:uracil-DNA glycosylase family 4
MRLADCYITATVRCAPPGNKPLPVEFDRCRPFLVEELRLLKQVRVVAALGKVAFDGYLRACRDLGHAMPRPRPAFGHGRVCRLPWGVTLLASYHPSQQNTQTGRLTAPMFDSVFAKARKLLGSA